MAWLMDSSWFDTPSDKQGSLSTPSLILSESQNTIHHNLPQEPLPPLIKHLKNVY